jgi:hypothetical protein
MELRRISFLIAFFAMSYFVADTSSSIIVKPKNTVTVVGESVQFNCTTSIATVPNQITWTARGTVLNSPGCISSYPTYWATILDDPGCDVVTLWNDIGVAGPYDCSDGGRSQRGLLIALARKPTCIVDPLPIRGKPFNVTCSPGSASYGTFQLLNPPVNQWISCDGLGSSASAPMGGPGPVLLSDVTWTAVASGKVIPPYTCNMHFDFFNGVDQFTDFATNNASYTIITSPVAVQYCPENMIITSSTGPYFAGDVLSCAADAYFAPTYNWTDNLMPTNSLHGGQNFTLPAGGGLFNLNCTAYSTGNLTCNVTRPVAGFAILCPYAVAASTTSKNAAAPEVGDTFTCMSVSNPHPANYTWTNSTGATVSTLNIVSITAPGPFNLTCTASVTVGAATCSNTTVINGTAIVCPRAVTILPSSTAPHVGDTYTCTATSDPNATYSWIDAMGAVTYGQSYTVHSQGPFSLMCNASITVNGRTCSNFSSINGTAVVCPYSLAISPQNQVVKVGDSYSCSAISYPTASYSWTDAAGAEVSTTPAVIVKTAGSFTFNCNASISVSTTTCSNVTSINGTAIICPDAPVVTPLDDVVFVGQTYNCSSSSNPSANYSWTNTSSGTVVSNQSSLIVSTSGPFSFNCTASVTVGNVTCSNSTVISGTAIACPQNATITPNNVIPHVGDKYTCTSIGSYPDANYTWYNSVSWSSVSYSPTASVSIPGSFELTCVAWVSFASANYTKSCQSNSSINGTTIVCPNAPTITPSITEPQPGQVYTCLATGNSTATYAWTNATGGTVSTLPTFAVSTPGPFNLTCTATVSVGGTPQCWNASAINGTVIVCPSHLTISPDNPNPKVNETYSCSATSYPNATYTWTDSTGKIISTQPTVNVNQSGNFFLTCNASITVGSTTCYNVTVINGTALECPTAATVSITPDGPVEPSGTTFTCNSSTYPAATYSWYDASEGGGLLAANTPTYQLNATGVYSLRCNATASLGSTQCPPALITRNVTIPATTTYVPTTVTTNTVAATTPAATTPSSTTPVVTTPPAASTAHATSNVASSTVNPALLSTAAQTGNAGSTGTANPNPGGSAVTGSTTAAGGGGSTGTATSGSGGGGSSTVSGQTAGTSGAGTASTVSGGSATTSNSNATGGSGNGNGTADGSGNNNSNGTGTGNGAGNGNGTDNGNNSSTAAGWNGNGWNSTTPNYGVGNGNGSNSTNGGGGGGGSGNNGGLSTAELLVTILVPIGVALLMFLVLLAFLRWYGSGRRGRGEAKDTELENRRRKQNEPSYYAPGYAMRANYLNGYGRY